jgi:hypothetical protein
MSSYGIKIISSEDESVLLDEKYTPLVYIGKASLQSNTQCAYCTFGGGQRPLEGRFVIFNTPYITPGLIPVCFMYNPVSRYSTFRDLEYLGSGIWQLTFYYGGRVDGSNRLIEFPVTYSPGPYGNFLGYGVQPTDIYVFAGGAAITPSGDPYGMLIKDSSEDIIFDSGWENKIAQILGMVTMQGSHAASDTITLTKAASKPAFLTHIHNYYAHSGTYDLWGMGLGQGRSATSTIRFYRMFQEHKYSGIGLYDDIEGDLVLDNTYHSIPFIDGAYYD